MQKVKIIHICTLIFLKKRKKKEKDGDWLKTINFELGLSSPQVHTSAEITNIMSQTIYNYVKHSQLFQYKKRKHHPYWKDHHIIDCLEWAQNHVS